jgi:hypothetical protein
MLGDVNFYSASFLYQFGNEKRSDIRAAIMETVVFLVWIEPARTVLW